MKNYINGIAITNNGIKVENAGIMSLVGHENVSTSCNKNFGSYKKIERHEDEYEKYIRSRGRFHRHNYY